MKELESSAGGGVWWDFLQATLPRTLPEKRKQAKMQVWDQFFGSTTLGLNPQMGADWGCRASLGAWKVSDPAGSLWEHISKQTNPQNCGSLSFDYG